MTGIAELSPEAQAEMDRLLHLDWVRPVLNRVSATTGGKKMSFWDTLLSTGAGFAAGGPIGAGVGLLGSLFGGGGSSSSAAPAAAGMTATAGMGPLDRLMVEEAYKQGLTQAMGGVQGAQVPRVKIPGMPDYDANQRGGHGYSPTLGRPDGAGAGSGRQAKDAQTVTPATPAAHTQGSGIPGLYNAYMTGRLSGKPQPGQLTAGLGTINAQAAQGASNLGDNLGARGLLHSGIMGGGLGMVEQGRMAAIGQFLNNLQGQAQTGQDTAARLYAAERAQNLQTAAQSGLMQQQHDLNQPTAWDYLAQALGLAGSLGWNPFGV